LHQQRLAGAPFQFSQDAAQRGAEAQLAVLRVAREFEAGVKLLRRLAGDDQAQAAAPAGGHVVGR
jgi:hypothetical protein